MFTQLLIFNLALETFADTRPFAHFPQPPFKFSRPAKVPKLLLPEKPNAKEIPFWRAKERVYKKMLDERAIPVSVVKNNLPNDLISYDVKGAGVVHAAPSAAFKIAQTFDKLPEVSANFKSSFYDEKNRQLFLVVEALGFQTRMILAIDLVSEKSRSEIQFEVVWGELKGMTGAIGFEKVDEYGDKTEVSILSHYQAKTFPLPKVFMGFAFEVITQKVANKMRSFIELYSSH